jgi:hypothetical protein
MTSRCACACPGGVWQDLYEYKVKVDLDNPQDASMVYFNFDGTVEVAVQKNNGMLRQGRGAPRFEGHQARVKDGVAYFTLTPPENLSVEFDDDRHHNLHLFTHAIRKDMPAVPANLARTTSATARRRPDPEGGVLRPRRAQRRLPPALEHHRVYPRLGGPEKPADHRRRRKREDLSATACSTACRHDDHPQCAQYRDRRPDLHQPAARHHALHQFAGRRKRSIRTIGGGKWSDGLGHFACERVKISDSFIRTSDDCMTFYNHRWDIWGNTRDIKVRDSTLWADVAHAVMIGIHGNTPTPAHPQPRSWSACASATSTSWSMTRTIRNTKGDRHHGRRRQPGARRGVRGHPRRPHRGGQAVQPAHRLHAKYNTSPGRGIENITLRNIQLHRQGVRQAPR